MTYQLKQSMTQRILENYNKEKQLTNIYIIILQANNRF